MTSIEFSQLRKQLGYTQEELAVIMDKSRATISRWETGKVSPIDHLAVLCIGTLPAKGKEEATDERES
jgi:DNA-binding XRE family transcriptional regulator